MPHTSNDISDSFSMLLFFTPTNASDWLARFIRLVDNDDESWENHCREAVAARYAQDVHAQDGYARVGWLLLTQGHAAEALPWFEMDASQGRMGWWTGLRHAETLAELGQSTEAEGQVAAIYGQYPEACNGYASLAWRLREDLGSDHALEWVERDAQDGRLTTGFAFNHAVMLAQAGRWPEAVAKVEQAYAANSSLKDGYARLAWIRAETRDWKAAWELAERDVHERRLTPAWQVNMAQLLGRIGDFTRATTLLEDAYGKDFRLQDGFARLGWIHAEVRDWKAAWELAESDVHARRLTPAWQVNMAQLLGRIGDFTRATTLLEDAYGQNDTLQDGFARLAWVAHEFGDSLGALNLLDRDACRGRLSEAWLADRELVRARLYGHCAEATAPCFAALLEAAIKVSGAALSPWTKQFQELFLMAQQLASREGAEEPPPSLQLLQIIQELGHEATSSLLPLLLSCLYGIEPNRKWRGQWRYEEVLWWLADYTERLKQAWIDLKEVTNCYSAMTARDKNDTLRHSLIITETMEGRPCGVIGDRLAQYGAVVQLAREGWRDVHIVELGTLFGGACMLFLLAARDMGVEAHVTCIDPLDGYYGRERDPVSGAVVRPETLRGNLARLDLPGKDVELRCCLSTQPEAWDGLSRGSVDVLLIDADHSHEGVITDWRNYHLLIRRGGLVIFDDYGGDHPGVVSAVDEICLNLQGWRRLGRLGTSLILRRDQTDVD